MRFIENNKAHMLKLPNGKTIDEQVVMGGMQDLDPANKYFLDIQTGEIVIISNLDDAAKSRLDQVENESDRYMRIPTISSLQQRKWMKRYVEEFVAGEELEEDDHLSEKLLMVLEGKDALRQFKDVLAKAENGWLGAWCQWSSEYVYEEMQEWMDTLPVEITDEWEAEDGCAVCSAMTNGDGSTEDLLKAFDEQNAKNKQLVNPSKKKKKLTN